MQLRLTGLTVLIADSNQPALKILKGILAAMGEPDVQSVDAYDHARQLLVSEPVDLCIIDLQLGKDRGPDLVREIRSGRDLANQKVPFLMTCSHTTRDNLKAVRDSGANMLLAKPYSVSALYDRLAWIAHRPRPFLWSDGYRGPDRRFKDDLIFGEDRRRPEDAEAETQAPESAHA